MPRREYPIYAQALEAYYSNHLRALRTFLDSRKLTDVEKNLIRARVLIKDGDSKGALQLLESLPRTLGSFLEAEKEILRSSAFFFSGHYEKAASANLRAADSYRAVDDLEGLFLATYNLSVDFQQLGCDELSTYYLNRCEEFARSAGQKALLNRALACHYARLTQYDVAVSWLKHAFEMQEELSFNDRMALSIVAAEIYFEAGEQNRSFELLKELHEDRTRSRERARIEFSYLVLSSFLKRTSLPAMPKSIEVSDNYSLKWKILCAIQSGELERAQELWSALCILEPLSFGNDFSAKQKSEARGIFYSYLRLLRSQEVRKGDLDGGMCDSLTGRLGLLHETLLAAKGPISKEHLIERVWNTRYDVRYDSRFYKLVERLKKRVPFEVVVENRAYFYRKQSPRRSTS
jgi:hypothetical protein